ncbi:MAG: YfcC family protein [Anaerolineales bacterium]|nr:YfcC family protein [Chloroflexota bacterium]MBL6979776.1 YfcC family protein [Anaerolineales bacterium]
MNAKAGAQISLKAFIQSVLILFAIMIIAGILTLVIPAGNYSRTLLDGREMIEPESFQFVDRPDYPIWRWFTAPVEVLWGPEGLIVIVIIIFILMVGGAFAVLDQVGILKAGIARIVQAFGGKKYVLLLVISLFFMALGSFFGILEEIVPLVPLMIALSYYLGWDALVGLGMSVLATNMGFSAAITNPFTIGIAQKIAGLPLFSGAWFRVPIFITIYAVFAVFLVRYAKRVERKPKESLVFDEDKAGRMKYDHLDLDAIAASSPHLGRAVAFFSVFLALILFVLIGSPFISVISDYALPLVGVFFLIGGVGAGLLSGAGKKAVLKALWEGISGIAPGIILILMAVSIKHIVVQGGIMDTILHRAAQSFSQASPFLSAVIIYFLALMIEFFVASGSAKAFLMMPILLPLADLVGVTRQVTVTAYCFGDGFSNLVYPTNPLLLIVLGLAVVPYPKWLKWTLPLWFWVVVVTVIFLGIGVAIGYGPF